MYRSISICLVAIVMFTNCGKVRGQDVQLGLEMRLTSSELPDGSGVVSQLVRATEDGAIRIIAVTRAGLFKFDRDLVPTGHDPLDEIRGIHTNRRLHDESKWLQLSVGVDGTPDSVLYFLFDSSERSAHALELQPRQLWSLHPEFEHTDDSYCGNIITGWPHRTTDDRTEYILTAKCNRSACVTSRTGKSKRDLGKFYGPNETVVEVYGDDGTVRSLLWAQDKHLRWIKLDGTLIMEHRMPGFIPAIDSMYLPGTNEPFGEQLVFRVQLDGGKSTSHAADLSIASSFLRIPKQVGVDVSEGPGVLRSFRTWNLRVTESDSTAQIGVGIDSTWRVVGILMNQEGTPRRVVDAVTTVGGAAGGGYEKRLPACVTNDGSGSALYIAFGASVHRLVVHPRVPKP